LQQILQVFVANDVAARAAKTAGVNRKSYVIQTPLTFHPAPVTIWSWNSGSGEVMRCTI
jgi:hypothetical protein